jgi:hypothetical protein
MNKPRFAVYEEFLRRFRLASQKAGKKQFVVNYFIASHPGSSLRETLKLALYLAKRRIKPEQIQDFIPTPMTRATCMHHTGVDPASGKPVHVPRTLKERRMQRALLQYDRPANRKLLEAALAELDSLHVLPKFQAAAGPRPARANRTWPQARRGTADRQAEGRQAAAETAGVSHQPARCASPPRSPMNARRPHRGAPRPGQPSRPSRRARSPSAIAPSSCRALGALGPARRRTGATLPRSLARARAVQARWTEPPERLWLGAQITSGVRFAWLALLCQEAAGQPPRAALAHVRGGVGDLAAAWARLQAVPPQTFFFWVFLRLRELDEQPPFLDEPRPGAVNDWHRLRTGLVADPQLAARLVWSGLPLSLAGPLQERCDLSGWTAADLQLFIDRQALRPPLWLRLRDPRQRQDVIDELRARRISRSPSTTTRWPPAASAASMNWPATARAASRSRTSPARPSASASRPSRATSSGTSAPAAAARACSWRPSCTTAAPSTPPTCARSAGRSAPPRQERRVHLDPRA